MVSLRITRKRSALQDQPPATTQTELKSKLADGIDNIVTKSADAIKPRKGDSIGDARAKDSGALSQKETDRGSDGANQAQKSSRQLPWPPGLISERSEKFYNGTYKWDTDGFEDENGVYKPWGDTASTSAPTPPPFTPLSLSDSEDEDESSNRDLPNSHLDAVFSNARGRYLSRSNTGLSRRRPSDPPHSSLTLQPKIIVLRPKAGNDDPSSSMITVFQKEVSFSDTDHKHSSEDALVSITAADTRQIKDHLGEGVLEPQTDPNQDVKQTKKGPVRKARTTSKATTTETATTSKGTTAKRATPKKKKAAVSTAVPVRRSERNLMKESKRMAEQEEAEKE